MSKNLRGLSDRKGLNPGLFEEIAGTAGIKRPDRQELLDKIAERSLVGKSSVLGASTFYEFLREEHQSKKVFICNGSACLTSGKQKKLKNDLLGLFAEDEIGTVTCLGHCHSNNAFMHENKTVIYDGNADLKKLLSQPEPVTPVFFTGTNAGNPALLGETGDIHEYYRLLADYSGDIEKAIEEIIKSGLRGRGGAGFSFSAKKQASRSAEGHRKYVVCNADEGDPGAFSDKWLLEERPHSVLFGMMVSGMITGADTGIVYIRGEYPESVESVKKAVSQLEDAGLAGAGCRGAGFCFEFHVVEGMGAYICGEETSLLNSIEGLRPEVRTRPPFPATYGLFGKPTILSNVETFANIRYILKEGGDAYAALGTEKSPGTKLVSLDGGFNKPGLYEIKMGTQLGLVFNEFGGGTKYPVKAFQVGGPLGGIVPASKVNDLTLDFESFSREGFLLGHAGVVSIPEDFPVIEFIKHLFVFTSAESCGKCFPCRIGSTRGMEMLSSAVRDGEKIDRQLFEDLLETMQLGSLCALGGGLPLPVRNALKYFEPELSGFFR